MDELTIEQVIYGLKCAYPTVEESANAIAAYFSSRGPAVRVSVERIEGSVAHFIQSTMIEDFETWRLNGYMGDPRRFETSRFEIDMAPQNAT